MKISKSWQQLNGTKKDALKAALLVLLAFAIVLKINLAETLAERLSLIHI